MSPALPSRSRASNPAGLWTAGAVLVLAAALPAQQPDYLPLHVGNQWIYNSSAPAGFSPVVVRLVRTEIESYLYYLVVWGGTIFFFLLLFLSFMRTVVTRTGDPSSGGVSSLFLQWVGLLSALLAVKVSRRNTAEKRTRLFSQLPVSTRELSVASWCVRLLCLSIPVLACCVFFARTADMPFGRFALVTLATYMGATTLVAAISVAMSVSHLPPPMSANPNAALANHRSRSVALADSSTKLAATSL